VFAVRQFARPWASKLLVVPVGFSGGVSRTLVLERPFFCQSLSERCGPLLLRPLGIGGCLEVVRRLWIQGSSGYGTAHVTGSSYPAARSLCDHLCDWWLFGGCLLVVVGGCLQVVVGGCFAGSLEVVRRQWVLRTVLDTGPPMSLDLVTLRPAFYVTTWDWWVFGGGCWWVFAGGCWWVFGGGCWWVFGGGYWWVFCGSRFLCDHLGLVGVWRWLLVGVWRWFVELGFDIGWLRIDRSGAALFLSVDFWMMRPALSAPTWWVFGGGCWWLVEIG
jgi:hypothetical protein